MTPNESLHLLVWYQQDWDITTTFIASLLSAEGHSLPDGCSFVVRVKKNTPPPLPEGQAEKIYPPPPCLGNNIPRGKETRGGRLSLTTGTPGTSDFRARIHSINATQQEGRVSHGSLIALAVHPPDGLGQRQKAQGTVPHLRRTNRLLCSAKFNAELL